MEAVQGKELTSWTIRGNGRETGKEESRQKEWEEANRTNGKATTANEGEEGWEYPTGPQVWHGSACQSKPQAHILLLPPPGHPDLAVGNLGPLPRRKLKG